MALGIFVGILPIMGIQMAVVTLLALPLRGSLKAAILGVWISNPVTFLPMYWGYYKFGLLFTSQGQVSARRFQNIITESADWDWSNMSESIKNIVDLGSHILIPMWIGSVILAVFFAIVTYFVTLRFVESYRQRMARKKERSESSATIETYTDHG